MCSASRPPRGASVGAQVYPHHEDESSLSAATIPRRRGNGLCACYDVTVMTSPHTVQPVDQQALTEPPWEMAVGETSKAYTAFQTYLELGADRSIRQAAIDAGHDYSTYRDWARRWRWTQRAAAFDAHVAEQRRSRFADEYAEVGRRHARQAQAALEALIRPAIVLLERMREDRTFLAELELMKPADLYSLTLQCLRVLPHVQNAENIAWGDGVPVSEVAYLSEVDYDAEHMRQVAATLVDIGALRPEDFMDEPAALTAGDD